MPTFSFNRSDSLGLQPVIPGKARVRCTGIEATESGRLAWTFEVIDHEDHTQVGRKVYQQTPTAGKGSFFTRKFLDALGVPYEENPETDTVTFQGEDCFGMEAEAMIGIRTYTVNNEERKANDLEFI